MDTTLLTSDTKYQNLPQTYIRLESDRPRLSEASLCENIPIIDLGWPDRSHVVQQICHACDNYGFFQVINHGVSEKVMEEMLGVGHEFFELPAEEKMKVYSDDPTKTMRVSTSFNVKKEKVRNWRDYLRLHCYPLHKYMHDWPSNPPSFKDIVSAYCKQVRELGDNLQELISESLGLNKETLKNVLVNTWPSTTIRRALSRTSLLGFPATPTPISSPFSFQDLHVAGLQVLHDGRWLTVKPCHRALVVNVGDQLQASSNGRYKSVWHRAIVNADKPRVSVASFLCPQDDALIAAPKELTCGDGDGGAGAIYRAYTYSEYYTKFWSRALDDHKHCLEFFKN